MNTMGPMMNNNPQGKAKGVNPNDVMYSNPGEKAAKSKEEAIVSQIKNGTKNFIKTLLVAGLILLGESLLIWKITDYIFDGQAFTFAKTFLSLLTIRLIFRTTIFDKKENKL